MLAPRAVKRKACPPVATSLLPETDAAERVGGGNAHGAANTNDMQEKPVAASEAGAIAQGSRHIERLQDGQDATEKHVNIEDKQDAKKQDAEHDSMEKHEKLLAVIEEAVSHWGLSLRNQELLVKFQSSPDGCEVGRKHRRLRCRTWAATDTLT